VVQFLLEASKSQYTESEMEDPDTAAYLHTLRESVLEAYTGLLTGMGGDGKAQLLVQYLEQIFGFLDLLSKDKDISNDVLKAAVGVIGDMAGQMGPGIAQWMGHPSVAALVKTALESSNSSVRNAGNFAKQSMAKLLAQQHS